MERSADSIVITGAALISSLGLTRQHTWEAILQGKCGIRPFTAMELPLPEGRNGGEAVALPEDYEPNAPREVRYLKRAIADALVDGGLDRQFPYPPERCGFMLGTTLHGMRAAGQFLRTNDTAPLKNFLAGATLNGASKGLNFQGLAATTCSACSSSLGAIALAMTLLETGQLDLVVAGGYDTISEYAYAGFNSLRLVAEGPLRPFARDRQGMKLAEGYGIVVLERASDARKRNQKALATVLGFGESADAHHLTQPHPQGEGASRAIAAALKSANLTPADIDLVAAHATGTPDNDAGEYAALSRVFGAELPRIPVVAFKSHLGHTLGGAGAVELILSMLALQSQTVPACANVKKGEWDFADLNLSTETKPATIRATLNTSLGFGGANTCVVLGPSSESSIQVSEPKSRNVFITGIGVVLPGVVGNEAFVERLSKSHEPTWLKDPGNIAENEIIHLLNARRVRRMSDYVKTTLAATALAFADAGISDISAFAQDCSVILGSTHGSGNYSRAYYSEIVKQGLIGANPMLFAEGVPNAAAAHLSLMLGLKGACQTVIGTRTAGLDALALAMARISSGRWDRAIVGAAEEHDELVNKAYEGCGLYRGRDAGPPFGTGNGFTSGGAAVTFLLESQESMQQRGGKARGKILKVISSRPGQQSTIDATRELLAKLEHPQRLMSSANGTWIECSEYDAIRRAGKQTTLGALYGHIAESFSAGPLLAIASILLTRKMPELLGNALAKTPMIQGASGNELAESFGAICTDYTGLVSGATIAIDA